MPVDGRKVDRQAGWLADWLLGGETQKGGGSQ